MSPQPVPYSRVTEAADAPRDPALAIADILPFDYADHARLREARWRRPQRDRRGITIALVIAVLLHLLGAWYVRDWMQLRVPFDDRSDVIRVRLIERIEPELAPEPSPPVVDELPPLAVAAPQPPPRTAPRASRPRAAAAPKTAATPVAPGSDATPQVRLYGPDGKLDVSNLSPEAPVGPPYEFRAPAIVKSPIMQHRSPLPYTPTEFEQYWPSDDETALGALVRRNTVSKTWRTPWGGQVTCTWMLFFGGCGWGGGPPNPEGLKKMRFNPPMKTVPKEPEKPPAQGGNVEEEKPLLNLSLPPLEKEPVPPEKEPSEHDSVAKKASR